MIVDVNKSYKDAVGNLVRIYAIQDFARARPVHGATQGRSGEWHIGSWRLDGTATLANDHLTEI